MDPFSGIASTEIAERIAKLSPQQQEQVLLFLSSLGSSAPQGESGSVLAGFSGSLDHVCALEMTRAIEEACGRVDAG